ncbi:MAG: DNA repair protein RadA [Chloroflexota bacterium]
MPKDRPRDRTVYICRECGRESPYWMGRCPGCQEWNTFVEKVVTRETSPKPRASVINPPQELPLIEVRSQERFSLPLPELNRVLGGGLVPGSLVLIGGDPGIGKSTLLLQIAALMSGPEGKVLYVSGEETKRQIKLRASRLQVKGEGLYLFSESDLDAILQQIEQLEPRLAIVDSIQSVYLPDLDAAPGSISQVRNCTLRLMRQAKLSDVPILIAGHVTKEGAIAGPRVLEHIVDVVLYLEGESFSAYRLLRSVKNRFGTTSEVGVFEMKTQGLVEVANPSEVFLAERREGAIGSMVVPVLEGNRPLMVEIQALTNPTSFGLPRRTVSGLDFGRLLLITAVLSRRVGFKLGNQDVMVNATGGLRVREPAADLGIALAIVSSFRDMPAPPGLVAMGEVGLSGELRAVPQLERRLSEAARMGFQRCLIPESGARNLTMHGNDMKLLPARSLREAIRLVWGES